VSATRSVIVVGIDGSDNSVDALRWALQQAQLTGTAVRAVASWRWPNYVTRVPPGVDLEAETAQTLADAVEQVARDFPGVDVAQHVVKGPAGPALLAQSDGAMLLVVGAQGRAAFPGMLLGSVAEYCVRNGPCPVVVVRTLAETPAS
jgi:nucleotide-binding universal stress UspA family protein